MVDHQNLPENQAQYRSGLTIYPSQATAIEKVLNELVEATSARHLLLVDSSGELINRLGDATMQDYTQLSSLIAGNLAASQEISHLTGEYSDQQMILREGKNNHFFIINAGTMMVLFAQIANSIPLGWARLAIKQTAQVLQEILQAQPDEDIDVSINLNQEEMARQLDMSLDSIWTE